MLPVITMALALCGAATPGTSVEPPQHAIAYSNQTSLRYNALGAANRFQVGYRYRLFQDSSVLKRSAFLGLGADLRLSPASGQAGIVVALQPIAPVLLSVGYSFKGWFGTVNGMQSFRDATQDYSDTALRARSNAGHNYATVGHIVRFRLRLRARLGPIVALNNTIARFSSVDTRGRGASSGGGTSVHYSQRLDAVVADEGWVVTNGTVLAWRGSVGLTLGVRGLLTYPILRDEHAPPGHPSRRPTFVLGPLASYRFFERPGELFDAPTLGLFVGWWLQHSYRTGVDVSQAVPQVMLFLTFRGQLWEENAVQR